ncbi:hypothetical protein KY312_04220 [Candidatus Woesearchaeota archaeon]|nr:hypothetical protein [Candidatus Woesearchaeota archaeon]
MKWKTIIKIDLVISVVVAVLLMMRGVMTQNKLTCGILNLTECALKQWLTQLLIFFVVIFIIIIILVVVFKLIAKRGPRIKLPKIKEPKMPKEKPMEKLPELGKDLELPEDMREDLGKIKI